MNHYKARGAKKVMVVNKCDLRGEGSETDLQLTEDMINVASKELRMDKVFRVSALTGEGVDQLFQEVARLTKKKTTSRSSCAFL